MIKKGRIYIIFLQSGNCYVGQNSNIESIIVVCYKQVNEVKQDTSMVGLYLQVCPDDPVEKHVSICYYKARNTHEEAELECSG